MAVAPNDSTIALSYGGRVQLYTLRSEGLAKSKEINLSCSSTPQDQRLNFSRDSSTIMILSKCEGGEGIVIDVFKLNGDNLLAKASKNASLTMHG